MYVISPSVSLRLTPSSSEEGKEYEPRFLAPLHEKRSALSVSWLHLMGELASRSDD